MSHADRNLLFGILAVQMNFVGRDALIAAMHAWVLERSQPLGRILVEQQALSPARHDLLEQLVDEHLAAHGGDAEKSLAAADGLGADPRRAGAGRRPRDPGYARPRPWRRGRHAAGPRGHALLFRAFAGRRLAVRDPPAARPGRPGADLRGPRRRAEPRGRAQGDSDPNTPTTRTAAPASCSRPRSPGGSSTPASCPVYGLGCDAEGRPFYAMRLVKGREPQGSDRALPRGRDGAAATRGSGTWPCGSS